MVVDPFYICQQGLSTSTLAASFGKVITSKKKLIDYKPEDLASTLLSAFTYNIAQVSYEIIFITQEQE
jgi:type II pantothenate kinase